MIGYKVMNYDPETNRITSGANSKLSFDLKAGATIEMPGQGIWMGLSREYVQSYYGDAHDHEAVLELEFDPDTIIEGNITDREAEFTTRSARILSFEIRSLENQEDTSFTL